MTTRRKSEKANWGGPRPGSGRRKGAKKETGYKAPPADWKFHTEPTPPKNEPQPDPPPPAPDPPPQENITANSEPQPPGNEAPPIADPQPETEQAVDDEIDFSQYRRVDDPKAETPPLEPPQPEAPKTPPPGSAYVVVINGKILMGIINFFAPTIFSWLSNFAMKGAYQADDFRLEDHEYEFLLPAADAVAKRIFAWMPDWAQLLFGYSMISWGAARKKKRWREAKESKGTTTINVDPA